MFDGTRSRITSFPDQNVIVQILVISCLILLWAPSISSAQELYCAHDSSNPHKQQTSGTLDIPTSGDFSGLQIGAPKD